MPGKGAGDGTLSKKDVCLRIGTVNVGTMTGRSGEVQRWRQEETWTFAVCKRRVGEEEAQGVLDGMKGGTSSSGLDVKLKMQVWVFWLQEGG